MEWKTHTRIILNTRSLVLTAKEPDRQNLSVWVYAIYHPESFRFKMERDAIRGYEAIPEGGSTYQSLTYNAALGGWGVQTFIKSRCGCSPTCTYMGTNQTKYEAFWSWPQGDRDRLTLLSRAAWHQKEGSPVIDWLHEFGPEPVRKMFLRTLPVTKET
jgi:hypothetical protein